MSELIKVYHPGNVIRDYYEALDMTQDEFAKRLGITGKALSLILDEVANITPDIALKLYNLTGVSIEFWLNLQSSYDAYKVKLKNQEQYNKELEIYKYIDKAFLKKLSIIKDGEKKDECIKKTRMAIQVSNLTNLERTDFYTLNKTTASKEFKKENIICRNVWISFALKEAKKIKTSQFDEKKLINYIPEFRKMTKLEYKEFKPMLENILSECGVKFIVLPKLKGSNISGAVKWINDSCMLALNDMGSYNDKFWFNFFHELSHVLQKIKRRMIVSDDSNLEAFTNEFAENIIIDRLDYISFIEKKNFSKDEIITFSNKIGIHPGLVVGRLQYDKIIPYNLHNNLKVKMNIFNEGED